MSDYQFNPKVEQWKEVIGFPGYEVSDHGRVRSFFERGPYSRLASMPQRYFIQSLNRDGYPKVTLHLDKKLIVREVHRLVLEAFQGPRTAGMEACHNDGDKNNNFLHNLRWDTRKNNICDRFLHSATPFGDKKKIVKITDDQVIKIRQLHSAGYSHLALAELFGIKKHYACLVAHGRRRTQASVR